ncbi:peptidoglycan-associated lipoprotein Pal [Zooshikella harenae]|uniref:Peptidoglycan-associated lipoprotein n=1 Tax=Zooshikella harenae TaxID=2827238 RepID=A0ABS5ZBL3_9GAMM|nr:peptidoglycan-associated lipoprotein Pal [Zooshikella harenae]MBU2710307.1 peptidoglycan-associated lipoprotein Pal [Zooshikella harenae]
MDFLKFGKVVLLASSVAWLAGCNTTGGDSASSVGDADVSATTGVATDGIDGSVDAQTQALLDKKVFLFGFDDSKILPEDYPALDAHAAKLASNSSETIIIQGHTDERGTREYNLALGERRAKAVKRYLVLKGVAPEQVETISYGEEQPVALGHDDQSWQQNRRAVIVSNGAY